MISSVGQIQWRLEMYGELCGNKGETRIAVADFSMRGEDRGRQKVE